MTGQAQLLPDALDLLILKAVSLGPLHGYGIGLLIERGALHPAPFRLVRQGPLRASLEESDNNGRAKFYELTSESRMRLRQEARDWNRLVAAMTSVLGTQPEEV